MMNCRCQGSQRRFLLFFFQAEDGIRDTSVTGVQTCALPISAPPGGYAYSPPSFVTKEYHSDRPSPRSEERRVGKECRSRRTRYHCSKRNNLGAIGELGVTLDH